MRMVGMFLSLVDAWNKGVQHEADWWSDALREAVATRSQDDQLFRRIRGETAFEFGSYIQHVHHDPIRVLDVGAGPVSQVGANYSGKTIEIVAVDPLAGQYAQVLTELGLSPKFPTIFGVAERLDEVFEADSFDFACCRNALDHAYDPLTGISQIIRVLRPSCVFFLSGYTNEAKNAKYVGLHQWNFEIENGALILWRPGIRIDVGEALSPELEIVRADAGSWYSVALRKISPGTV